MSNLRVIDIKKAPGHRIRATRSDGVFYVFNYALLTIFLVLTVYPLITMISLAISSPHAVFTGQVTFLPVGFSLKGFKLIFTNADIVAGFLNSVFYTVVGTAMSIALTMMTGFVLSRKELIGRSAISMVFALTMWFSGGIIPFYLLIRDMGIFNTRWAMLLPGMLSVFNMIICRTFISETIPEELYESVSIDGCGYFRYFMAIVLPLSKAVIAVLTLWYAIGKWNSYFNALILLYDKKLFPLQLVLRNLLITPVRTDFTLVDMNDKDALGLPELMKNALILAACLPLWILYPFVQKYFMKGVLIGSIKG